MDAFAFFVHFRIPQQPVATSTPTRMYKADVYVAVIDINYSKYTRLI